VDERLRAKHKACASDEYERGCEEESGWIVVDREERSCPEVKPSRSFIYFEPHHASVRATSLSDVGVKLNPFRAPETQPNQSRRRQATSLAPRHSKSPLKFLFAEPKRARPRVSSTRHHRIPRLTRPSTSTRHPLPFPHRPGDPRTEPVITDRIAADAPFISSSLVFSLRLLVCPSHQQPNVAA
jgi:hypothetical protein